MAKILDLPFYFPVPTSSIIGRRGAEGEDRYKVCVIEQQTKHKGRMTVVGGRVVVPGQSHVECALEEWGQEVGGKGATLTDINLWAIKTDPQADVRQATLGKLTHESCPSALFDTPVNGHYGVPDHLYLATVVGEPWPSDHEAKRALFIDVRDMVCTESEEASTFGAQHDLVLLVYRLYLAGRAVDVTDFVDMAALRSKLPGLLQEFKD